MEEIKTFIVLIGEYRRKEQDRGDIITKFAQKVTVTLIYHIYGPYIKTKFHRHTCNL